MQAIFKNFNEFLSRNFFIPEVIIQPWKHLRRDLGLNSIEFLELIVYIENAYGIQIDDLDLEKIHTVKDLSDFLEMKMVTVTA